MRITELIAPCGNTVPLFPGTPSKCLTLHSNQNPPANAQMGCCSIQRDFSHWIFSTKCGHANFLTTLLMKRINTTMQERIVTDNAESTLSCLTLYFNDIMNIFTQRYKSHCVVRVAAWACSRVATPKEHNPCTWFILPFLSTFLQKHCQAHNISSQIHCHFGSMGKGIFDRNIQFYEGAVHRGHGGCPRASVPAWAVAGSVPKMITLHAHVS